MNDQRGADIERFLKGLIGNSRTKTRTKNPLITWNNPKETFRRKKAIFGYTPWKTRDGKQTGFYAVQYSSGNRLNRMVKKMRFSSRKKARARALKWYYQYYQIGDHAPKPKEPERI
jgi:hypothetical protein